LLLSAEVFGSLFPSVYETSRAQATTIREGLSVYVRPYGFDFAFAHPPSMPPKKGKANGRVIRHRQTDSSPVGSVFPVGAHDLATQMAFRLAVWNGSERWNGSGWSGWNLWQTTQAGNLTLRLTPCTLFVPT